MNANQSNNWFGYNQGTLEQGGKQFHSITGEWTVPAASRHRAGQSAASSDWIGIGGGCVDAHCTVGDNTLIQTGTEQDVSASGVPSYSAWYELIPAPSLRINMTVRAGDHMHAQISETVSGSNVWKITLRDVTRNETFRTTVPYSSTHATAEWIEETPLLIGTNAGLAPLPESLQDLVRPRDHERRFGWAQGIREDPADRRQRQSDRDAVRSGRATRWVRGLRVGDELLTQLGPSR